MKSKPPGSETGFDPALYARFPTEGERPEGEVEELERIWCRPRGWEWLTAINNNFVGVYYLGVAMLFFVLAGILALLMRVQLAAPLNNFLPPEVFNQVFTVHGTVMMFLFAVPAVEALGVLMLPQMLGARDLPFPRLSAYAFWAYLIGGLAFFASLFFGLAPNGGWFMYPPLTSMAFSPGINADFWLLGIGFIEISAIAGAIEIIVGVMRTRAPGMTMARLPVFAWAMLIFAVMIIIAFPSVILATTLLELERALDWPLFDAARGGDPLLWQHLFWFFGHPEVYIIFLPASGAMSAVVAAVSRTPLVGHRLVVMAMIATGFISFGVWAHHMFTVGMPEVANGAFSAASMAVAVPAGLQVFSWIATVAAGRLRLNTPGLFVLGTVIIFTLGGLTGVMAAFVPFDWQVHDTYFIVAHLHYVLIGGMVFPLFAAIYYWMPMVSRPLSERWGKWAFWLMFTGMHVTFMTMHLTGLMGMPRRVYTYLPGRSWDLPNLISTIGAFLFAAGVLVWIIDMCRNFRPFGNDTHTDPYEGPGLEWAPAGLYGVRSIPVVTSLYPMWDQPTLGKAIGEGRHFLPNSATGERETIVTSPLNAEPQYLQRMPKPGPAPIWAGLFTAGAFLLLTVQAYWPSVISGVAAIYCMMQWCWSLDHRVKRKTADIGAGIRVPTYASGTSSHGWWAMVITLIVAFMVWALGVFSYVFLWARNPDMWRGAPPLPPHLLALGAGAVALGLAFAAPRLLAADRRRLATGALVTAAALAMSAFIVEVATWRGAGFEASADARGAIVYALWGLQGFMAGVSGLMGLYATLRLLYGHVEKDRPATFELIALFLGYTAVQGLLTGLAVRLFT